MACHILYAVLQYKRIGPELPAGRLSVLTIEACIDKFAICYAGGDTLAVHACVTDEEIQMILELKPQILQVLKARQQAARERTRQAHERINSIPGVCELRQFYQNVAGQEQADRRWEAFVSQHPEIDLQTAQTALQIEEDRFSPNAAVRAYAQAAFEDLADGKEPDDVARRYQRQWQKVFDERLQWCK